MDWQYIMKLYTSCWVCIQIENLMFYYHTLFKYVMYVMKLSLIVKSFEKEAIWLYAEVFLFLFCISDVWMSSIIFL